jgi:3-carboxy-cis,cis-muconate cycloisomerase
VNVFGHSLLPAAARTLFDDAALCRALLAFESALAEAQAAEGLIPADAAAAIVAACETTAIDPVALADAARHSGALAVPLVAMVAKALAGSAPGAVRHLHVGATTQDVVDTAQVLMTRHAFAQLLQPLDASITLLQQMAREHAHTPMLARTLLQPAQVTTWGLKCAQWLQALRRSRVHLRALAQEALVLQLGGAVGNLSALGHAGEAVAQRMATRLGLRCTPGPWHTQRDAWVRFGLEVAVLAGSLSKIAKDLALLSQAEVGEVSEGTAPGDTSGHAPRGGSSAMPHKRNPVACMQAIAACAQVPGLAATLLSTMAQAHERALGEWQAEFAVWPQLWIQAFGAMAAVHDALAGLQVDTARMVHNIDRTQGLVHSEALTQVLAAALGKAQARTLVQAEAPLALAEGTPLLQRLLAQPAVLALAAAQRGALATACDLQAAAEPSARLCNRLLQDDGDASPPPH